MEMLGRLDDDYFFAFKGHAHILESIRAKDLRTHRHEDDLDAALGTHGSCRPQADRSSH